jgi:nucleotide-binding universal stress UspA family protein
MYKRMLVPLDGSELSEVVFPYARELAGRLDLEIILLHVHHSEEGEVPLHQAYIERKAEILKHQIEEARQKTDNGQQAKAIQMRGELVLGYPAEEILRYADEKDVDLILMATHGRSGVRRWVLGSVAEKVLRASKTPVWLVRAGAPTEVVYDKWPERTILVPLDGSKLAEAVLLHVKTLAKQRGAEPIEVVLFVVSEHLVKSGYYIPDVLTKPEELKEYLAKIEKRLKDAGLSVRSEVRKGKPAEQIIEYASENPFNLIVMSTHGRSGLGRWVFGSVADKVLHGASSPIFLVRPQ